MEIPNNRNQTLNKLTCIALAKTVHIEDMLEVIDIEIRQLAVDVQAANDLQTT